jgi:hypothetical protein
LASIKGKVVYNTLTEMVANETIEEPLLLQATEEEDYGHGEEGEGSGPTMDEGFLNMEAQELVAHKNMVSHRSGNPQ